MILVSFYIKSQIDAFNMDYYYGKDNGAFVQSESIVIFSFLFFVLISRKNIILRGLLGFVIGIISSIISYLFFGTEILFPASASLLIILIFYLLENISQRRHEKKQTNKSSLEKSA